MSDTIAPTAASAADSQQTPATNSPSENSDTKFSIKPDPDQECHNNANGDVLVGTIDDELEFDNEPADLLPKANHSTSKPNNISLCNENDAENIDDNSLLVGVGHDESGLYDDVMTGPNISASEFSEFKSPTGDQEPGNSNNQKSEQQMNSATGVATAAAHSGSSSSLSNSNRPALQGFVKRVPCYVGNLTWWTTDRDLSEAVEACGVTDLLDIKFYENKINGQSKGFAMVTCGSDQSFRTLMDKLPKREINAQVPIVTPFNRHNFNQFEEQARKDMPTTVGSGGSGNESGYGGRSDHFGGGGSGGQYYSHGNHHQGVGFQHGAGQMNMNRNRFPSNSHINNNNSPAGLLGQGPRPTNQQPNNNNNSMLQNQSRPGLVGNYQPRMPNTAGQSILGINNPSNNNNMHQNTRPNFNTNNINRNNSINNNGILSNQGGSLMGNRPPININQTSNGLIPMRPSINPALVGNNGPIGQGVGLLNNPRMPHGNNPNMNLNNSGNLNANSMQRQEWDSRGGQGQFSGGVVTAGNQANVNQMMLMNQQANTRMATGSYSYGTGVSPAISQQNGILPNPPHPFQHQTQQQQQPQVQQQHQQMQPNYQHPHAGSVHAGQQGYNQPNMMVNGMIGGVMGHQAYGQEQGYYQAQQVRLQTESGMVGQHHHQMQQHQAQMKLGDIEFQEAFEKNRIVSSSAITRAVQDASIGQYPSAIETLITAISLIKQSKIAGDERCKLFIISLQDTKKSIEDKYYGMSSGMEMMPAGGPGMMMVGHSRPESRDRERLKRSHSGDDTRDRRERDRGEDRDRDRSERVRDRSERDRGSSRREKHHRSHRERSSRDRSRDRRVVSSMGSGMESGNDCGYYDEPVGSGQSGSSRYHRSRH